MSNDSGIDKKIAESEEALKRMREIVEEMRFVNDQRERNRRAYFQKQYGDGLGFVQLDTITSPSPE